MVCGGGGATTIMMFLSGRTAILVTVFLFEPQSNQYCEKPVLAKQHLDDRVNGPASRGCSGSHDGARAWGLWVGNLGYETLHPVSLSSSPPSLVSTVHNIIMLIQRDPTEHADGRELHLSSQLAESTDGFSKGLSDNTFSTQEVPSLKSMRKPYQYC